MGAAPRGQGSPGRRGIAASIGLRALRVPAIMRRREPVPIQSSNTPGVPPHPGATPGQEASVMNRDHLVGLAIGLAAGLLVALLAGLFGFQIGRAGHVL